MNSYRVYYAKDMMAGYRKPAFSAEDYTEVALVDAENLGELFRKMNVVDGDEVPVQMKIRSMSCGDIAFDTATHTAYFCAPVGWEEVVPTMV